MVAACEIIGAVYRVDLASSDVSLGFRSSLGALSYLGSSGSAVPYYEMMTGGEMEALFKWLVQNIGGI